MTRPVVGLLLSFSFCGAVAAQNAGEVREHELGTGVLSGTSHELVLPGRLAAWSPECNGLSRAGGVTETTKRPCGLFVLGRADDEPSDAVPDQREAERTERYTLGLFSVGSQPPFVSIGTFESRPVESLQAFDLDGDGRGEPLIGASGTIYRVHADGRLEALLEDEPDRVHLADAVQVLGSDGPRLALPGVGVLRLLRGRDGALVVEEELELPVRVDRRDGGLRLRSPRLRAVDGRPGLLAVGPEAQGDVRLRSLLLEVDPQEREVTASQAGEEAEGDDEPGSGPWLEAWSRLPGPERIEGASYVAAGEEVALLVHTLRSDRMGILERKKVRVFSLRSDRTREGEGPRFAGFTVSRLWQPLGSTLDDIDRDGVLDLLLFQHEGFDGDKLLAEAFPGRGAGGGMPAGFEPRSWRSKLDVASARWTWGDDLTGDGRGDLLLWSGGRLLLFPAVETPKKKGFLEREPVAELRPPQPLGSDRIAVETVIDVPRDGEDGAIEASALEDEPPDEERESDREADEEPDPRVRWRPPRLLDLDGDGFPEVVVPGRHAAGDRLLLHHPH